VSLLCGHELNTKSDGAKLVGLVPHTHTLFMTTYGMGSAHAQRTYSGKEKVVFLSFEISLLGIDPSSSIKASS
jgi:hypothetical protein